MDDGSLNPRIPDFLRAVTWLECLVVASAAGLLLAAPKWGGQDIWAWQTPPFNARYVGVIYLAALVALVILAVSARWSPGRLVLWMIFTFTTAIMVVMLAYADRFEWARFATWVFWALYLFLPVNSAVFLWRLRALRVPGPLIHMPGPLTALALVLTGYGVALLAVPEDATSFWPWPVDAFHARIYAATYLTPGVGAWVLRGGATRDELRTLGVTLIVFGVAAILALLLTDPTVPAAAQVDYDAGTWAFFAINVAPVLAGAALLSGARASAPVATPA
jgi:hypothetical protein